MVAEQKNNARNIASKAFQAGVAKLADAQDLKS
jgi:hypothetical protein